MSDFTADALTVTTATATVAKVSDSQWTTALTAQDGVSVGTLSVEMLAGEVTDLAGNVNTASNTRSITFDLEPPTVAVSTAVRTLTLTLALSLATPKSQPLFLNPAQPNPRRG